MNLDITKYKLQINSPTVLKDQETFIKFYTGGPQKVDHDPIFVKI